MKLLNIIPIFLFTTIILPVQAQFTKGGSTKNYEEYHYITDTIRTPVTITTTPKKERQTYFYFSPGLLVPLNGNFRRYPSEYSYIEDPYEGREGMGGSVGFRFSLGGFHSLRKLNNKIHPLVNIGIGHDYSIGVHPYTWKAVNNFYATQVSYNPFVTVNASFVPMVSINPLWEGKNKLHIDFGYKIGFSVIAGGGHSYKYAYSSYPYGSTYYVERDDAGMGFLHGPTLRVRYKFVHLGLDAGFIKDNTQLAYRFMNTDLGQSGSFDSRVNLSSFTLSVGFNF